MTKQPFVLLSWPRPTLRPGLKFLSLLNFVFKPGRQDEFCTRARTGVFFKVKKNTIRVRVHITSCCPIIYTLCNNIIGLKVGRRVGRGQDNRTRKSNYLKRLNKIKCDRS